MTYLGKSWIDDVGQIIASAIPKYGNIDLGSEQNPFQNLYLSGEIFGPGGVPITNPLSVYAAGTAYTLTSTPAALDFGTTDPVLVIDQPGTYSIRSTVTLNYVAATFAASQAVTLKLRRTNNTPADLVGSTLVVNTAIITTQTFTFGTFNLPEVIYTTVNANDSITLFGSVAVVPGAGALNATAASIVAVRLY